MSASTVTTSDTSIHSSKLPCTLGELLQTEKSVKKVLNEVKGRREYLESKIKEEKLGIDKNLIPSLTYQDSGVLYQTSKYISDSAREYTSWGPDEFTNYEEKMRLPMKIMRDGRSLSQNAHDDCENDTSDDVRLLKYDIASSHVISSPAFTALTRQFHDKLTGYTQGRTFRKKHRHRNEASSNSSAVTPQLKAVEENLASLEKDTFHSQTAEDLRLAATDYRSNTLDCDDLISKRLHGLNDRYNGPLFNNTRLGDLERYLDSRQTAVNDRIAELKEALRKSSSTSTSASRNEDVTLYRSLVGKTGSSQAIDHLRVLRKGFTYVPDENPNPVDSPSALEEIMDGLLELDDKVNEDHTIFKNFMSSKQSLKAQNLVELRHKHAFKTMVDSAQSRADEVHKENHDSLKYIFDGVEKSWKSSPTTSSYSVTQLNNIAIDYFSAKAKFNDRYRPTFSADQEHMKREDEQMIQDDRDTAEVYTTGSSHVTVLQPDRLLSDTGTHSPDSRSRSGGTKLNDWNSQWEQLMGSMTAPGMSWADEVEEELAREASISRSA